MENEPTKRAVEKPRIELTLTISESEYLATAMEVASQSFLEAPNYNPSMSRWTMAFAKGLRAKVEARVDAVASNAYDIYYSDGGHGGPFATLDDATAYARRYMDGSNGYTRCAEIRPCESKERGGFGRSHVGSFYVEESK